MTSPTLPEVVTVATIRAILAAPWSLPLTSAPTVKIAAKLLMCLLAISVGGCGGDDAGRDDQATAADGRALDAGALSDGSGDGSAVRFGDDTATSRSDAAVDAGQTADAASTQDAIATKLGPPYPIVLAHGFMGFDKFAGNKFISYFYKVPEALAVDGEKHVLTPAVDPFNSSTKRGGQLVAEIEKFLAKTGHAKVNIIGHSQGGLDARVVAHLRPDLVASVVTYATPNKGTPVADWVMALLANENLQKLLDAMAKLMGAPLYDKAGEKSSVIAGIETFTQPGIKAFNESYPDRKEVKYFSITGRTDNHVGGPPCLPDEQVDFVTKFTLVLDPVDPLFAVQEAMLDGGFGAPFPNDGMVRVKDARHGVFLGCVPADHMDQVGHLLGDKPGLLNPWDHRLFFRALVKFLRSKGV